MPRPTAPKPRTSLLDASIGGYVLRPEAKAAIRTMAAGAVRLDNRRRAILGQAGSSPLAMALVAAGAAPPSVLTNSGGQRPSSGATGATSRSAKRSPPASPLRAAVRELLDRSGQTMSDNAGYYADRIREQIQDGQKWLHERPKVIRENLDYYAPGLPEYLDMVSKVDMTDTSMLTPEQIRLREEAKRQRPHPDYNTPYYQEIARNRAALHPVLRQADAGVRGAADTVSFGGANYFAALGDTATNPYSFAQNLEGERYIDLLDSRDARTAQTVGRVAGAFLQPESGYVAAAKTLPSAMARAAVVDGAGAFAHDFVSSPGDLEDRAGSGFKAAATEALVAPLGPLTEHGVAEFAPLAAREFPFLKSVLSKLATIAPKEFAKAMEDAENQRAAQAGPTAIRSSRAMQYFHPAPDGLDFTAP
jgi:hypothetical protein